jgi:hypothetical protein
VEAIGFCRSIIVGEKGAGKEDWIPTFVGMVFEKRHEILRYTQDRSLQRREMGKVEYPLT